MKLLKKMSLTAGLTIMLTFAVACGSNKESDATSQGYEQEQTQESESREMTPEERYEAMNATQADAKSMDATIIVDMDMTMGGENVKTVTSMRMSTLVDPIKMRMEMDVDMGELGSQTMAIYAEVTEDNKGMMYIYDGTAWTSQEMPDITAAMEQYNPKNSVSIYSSGITELAEAGREQVGGVETVKLTGVLTGEALQESVMSSGSLDSLSGLLDQEQLNSIFANLEQESSQIEIWVDAETNEMVKYSQDMTSVMNKLYENLGALMAEGTDLDMSVGKMIVTIENIVFNNVEDFEIPAEAKQ